MNEGVFEIRYMYRDAGNYKFRGSILIYGEIKFADIEPHLLFGEYFIPQEIGIPDLRPTIKNNDDHELHEFEEICPVEGGEPFLSASNLLSRIEIANKRGWFRNK